MTKLIQDDRKTNYIIMSLVVLMILNITYNLVQINENKQLYYILFSSLVFYISIKNLYKTDSKKYVVRRTRNSSNSSNEFTKILFSIVFGYLYTELIGISSQVFLELTVILSLLLSILLMDRFNDQLEMILSFIEVYLRKIIDNQKNQYKLKRDYKKRFNEIPNSILISPDWINSFYLPQHKEEIINIEKKENSINEYYNEIYSLEDEITEITKSNIKFEDFRSILYTQGGELEFKVFRLLKFLGFDPLEGAKGKEDIVIKNNNVIFVIEVKGLKNLPKQKSIENTRTHLTQYKNKNGVNKKYKGVLIVGREANKPILERSNRVFQKNLIELLEAEGICALTTEQLFQIAIDCSNNKITNQEILDKMQRTNGQLKGFNLAS